MNLQDFVREIPDFPKPGIGFKDITPLLASPDALRDTVIRLADPFRGLVDVVVGIESRGFILGGAVAVELGAGFSIVRKPGKLPSETHEARYDLEYGSGVLEIHQDGFPSGSRVLLVDDLIATGGTAAAAIELVERLRGSIVACAFAIELAFLNGREKLAPHEIHALIRYET